MNEANVLSNKIEIDSSGYTHLVETAKWAKFLAIVGIVLSCILVLVALFAGTFMELFLTRTGGESTSTVFVSIAYIIIAALYFFTSLYLYRFGVKMQYALNSNDQQLFNVALQNQRMFYRIMGIIMIIYLSIVALIMVIVFFALGSRIG